MQSKHIIKPFNHRIYLLIRSLFIPIIINTCILQVYFITPLIGSDIDLMKKQWAYNLAKKEKVVEICQMAIVR
jgi:hypothetical protein